jgi:hypothetical protein
VVLLGRRNQIRPKSERLRVALISFQAPTCITNTSDELLPGSMLILAGNRGHGMPTGHVAYVEDVIPAGPSSYRLILSHTNYDRKCSLENRVETLYHRDTLTLDVLSGAWKSWGRRLKVAGFIRG